MEHDEQRQRLEKEEKYVQKIRNDVDERLFDLLVYHIKDVHERIRIHGEDNEELRMTFIATIERAIRWLERHTTKYNKRTHARYTILCCNALLKFDTGRQDLKDRKKRLIEDFTQSEENPEGYIPLDYQMNEVRITYDVDYLSYLVKKYCGMARWPTALYCLNAVELIEPDMDGLDEYREEIHNHLEHAVPGPEAPMSPRGRSVLLDSNIALALITNDIGEYRFPGVAQVGASKLCTLCDVHITPAVEAELRAHVSFLDVGIWNFCKTHGGTDAYNSISPVLHKRLDTVLQRYAIDVPSVDPEILERIRAFYYRYVPALEQIFFSKIKSMPVSHKLRKLAQRVDLLPEEGDMRLLAEAIALSQAGATAAICSQDKDFLVFSQEIRDTFSIDVCNPDCPY
jgi:hypothetical protein